MKKNNYLKRIAFFSSINRYESETKTNIVVTNQASVYIEFKLKSKQSLDKIEEKSNIKTIYNQSKEFVLHRTLFLIIAGAFGLLMIYFYNKNKIFSSSSSNTCCDICCCCFIFTM